jgi:hypothetical protein
MKKNPNEIRSILQQMSRGQPEYLRILKVLKTTSIAAIFCGHHPVTGHDPLSLFS